MKDYIVFDLKEIARELGAHFTQIAESEHIAWCSICSNQVTQRTDECPGCQTKVVWKNSREWKHNFGSPTEKIREYRAIKPTDDAGKQLMKRARLPGFKDKAEHGAWEEVRQALSQEQLREIVDYCAQKTSGRGLVKYTLNAAVKKAETLPSARDEFEFGVIG